MEQFVDPQISKQKFDTELQKFRVAKEIHRQRGILLLDAEFPNMRFAFCAPQLVPATIVFSVIINFDNYDLQPLSVVFIDPFTNERILKDRVGSNFTRMQKMPDSTIQPFHLLQQDLTGFPFICMPGIREYHSHPAHTGDSWFLHRNIGGEGSLGFILDKLHLYGVSSVNHFTVPVNLNLMINVPRLQIDVDNSKIPQ